jgi:hypothetical protein
MNDGYRHDPVTRPSQLELALLRPFRTFRQPDVDSSAGW